MLETQQGPQPYFDMELFLLTAEETRLDGATLESCIALWAKWSEYLQTREIQSGDVTYLAAWLEEDVEHEVDALWTETPSVGFRYNALAQTLIMCATHERVPEVEEAGCAPVPQASQALADTVNGEGLPAIFDGAAMILGRRYAVVTPMPFRGGCEICALQRSCPRSGQEGETFFTIPGGA